MHSYAVIPPLLLPPDERRRKFTNTNGLIQDPMLIYNERKYVNMWTDQERETFKEKYLQHPKNFGLIGIVFTCHGLRFYEQFFSPIFGAEDRF